MQLFDEEFADAVRRSTCSMRPSSSPRSSCRCARSGASCSTAVVDNFFAETEQVAFCTQNIVRRHRLHQRSAAAGAQLLVPRHAVEAAREPELHPPADQRAEVPVPPLPAGRPHGDGQPVGPRELRAQLVARRASGPREDPERGFESFADDGGGARSVASGPSSFADHYSQARQFYVSQTPIERQHIATRSSSSSARSRRPDIRARMVAQPAQCRRRLRAGGRRRAGLGKMPAKAKAAKAPISDLPPSPALSIVANGPESFAGRKVGMLVTDGTDAALVAALRDAIDAEGAVVELIAPKIGGATLSDGVLLEAQQKIDGGPSVLYDAVAVLDIRGRSEGPHGGSRGEGLRLRRLRSRGSLSRTPRRPRRCSPRRVSIPTTGFSLSRAPTTPTDSSTRAASCVTG